MKFEVEINGEGMFGEVYINGEFVAQLCYDNDAIGCAIANWLNEQGV